MAEDQSRLKRWHRRKVAVRDGAPEAEIAALHPDDDAVPAVAPEQAGTTPAPGDEATQDIPDLPDVDTLDAQSDFSVFMGDGVPEDLQRLALRKLWRLDPVFANVDGLVDYGEDFTDAATVIEGLKTVYRVGKGMLTDEEVAARDAVGEPPEENMAESTAENTAENGDENTIETAGDAAAEQTPAAEEPSQPEDIADIEDESVPPKDPEPT